MGRVKSTSWMSAVNPSTSPCHPTRPFEATARGYAIQVRPHISCILSTGSWLGTVRRSFHRAWLKTLTFPASGWADIRIGLLQNASGLFGVPLSGAAFDLNGDVDLSDIVLFQGEFSEAR